MERDRCRRQLAFGRFHGTVLARLDFQRPNPQFFAVGGLADISSFSAYNDNRRLSFVELPTHRVDIHAPRMSASEEVRLGPLLLSDRNRFERLIGIGRLGIRAGLGSSPFRYRNRLLVDVPFAGSSALHVFAKEEAFYDFEVSGWDENRVRAGVGARLSKRLSLDIKPSNRTHRRHPVRSLRSAACCESPYPLTGSRLTAENPCLICPRDVGQ